MEHGSMISCVAANGLSLRCTQPLLQFTRAVDESIGSQPLSEKIACCPLPNAIRSTHPIKAFEDRSYLVDLYPNAKSRWMN